MSETKTKKSPKKQLGQFFTPKSIAEKMVKKLQLTNSSTVLEPSFGNGSFILPLIRQFMKLHSGNISDKLNKILTQNIFAIEIDKKAYEECLFLIEKEFGKLPLNHNLFCGDFFLTDINNQFDFIIGNPPFGGTINPKIQDQLDNKYGERDGIKIKKETYSFFLVACVEKLKPNGQLKFICSDSFLTIPTMKGLREFLINRGTVEIKRLSDFSEETEWPMVIIDYILSGKTDQLMINGNTLDRKTINLTGNKSWQITNEFSHLFTGSKIGDFMVASSGMTIGCNELFVRNIVNNTIEELYDFEFFDDPITLDNETSHARLHKLSENQITNIKKQEKNKETKRNIRCIKRKNPISVKIPNENYLFYNKSCSNIIYSKPSNVIYWKDDGDAVLTFKKNGNWYLHGVGGKPFFKREGLSWQLISSTLNTRYLPPNYILDSGAPCAFLRDKIDQNELWFILGWTLTPLCTKILKTVINHTKNIQSKDFEKLPYPFWVKEKQKKDVIEYVKELVNRSMNNEIFNREDEEIKEIYSFYDQ